MTIPVDTILENRYRVDWLLAKGGMGAVYRGFDTKLDVPVALKENFFDTPQAIIQFKQEALILARLRHPNLPRVIDHFSFEDQQYLVMDFVEGDDLWKIVRAHNHPFTEKQALDCIIQVCGAVHYLHQQDPPIIHRDIKPQNIKITPANQAVLVDFGIAKVGGGDTRTRTGAHGVTPGFSPPEQYAGSGTSSASDIYALGATLYAVLSGRKPPDSISRMVHHAEFIAPDVLNPALSRQVSQAIIHAMQPQPPDRPQSVAVWQQDLEAIRQMGGAAPEEVAVITSLALVERILCCAFRMSENNLGAIFIVGNADTILEHSDASEISRFALIISAQMDQLSDQELINFAKQDGATVIDTEGKFRGCMVLLRPKADTRAEIGPGKGARHSSAAKMSAETQCIAITVSHDGPITIYDSGRRVLSL